MWRERGEEEEQPRDGERIAKFRAWLLKTARLCPVQFGPARASCSTLLGLQRLHLLFVSPSCLFATSSSAISSSFSLGQNAERERLVNEAHAHMLARTRSVPSSPFPCVAPWSPCLAAGLPPSALPSVTAAASTARFFLRCRRRRRRRHGLKHNAPRRTA